MRFGFSTRDDPFVVVLGLVVVCLVLVLLMLEGSPQASVVGVVTVRTVVTEKGYGVVLYSSFPRAIDVYLVAGSRTLGHVVVPPGRVVVVDVDGFPSSIVFYYSGKRLIENFHEGTYFLTFTSGG